MRSLGIFTAVATDPFNAVVFAGNPEDIRFLVFCRKEEARKKALQD